MGMTIDEAIGIITAKGNYSYTVIENEAKDVLVDTARKYQMVRADYENRLKADLKAILTELQLEIEESENCGKAFHLGLQMASNVIQQKINELKQESTTKTDKVDCKHTDCNNCVNHKCCDYEPTTKNDLGVDCIVDVLGGYTDLDIPYKREIAENILTKLSSVTPQPRWISTSERLPKEDGEYYATVYDTDENYKYMDIAELEDGIWQYKDYIKVLAWMPLPAPYEPQESEG